MKKTIMLTLTLLIIAAALVMIIPGTRDKISWKWYSKRNTVQDYNSYLQLNKNGKHIPEARDHVKNLLLDTVPYNLAVQKGTATAMRYFLQKFPGHIREQDARFALSEAIKKNAFKKAVRAKSISKLSLFVKFYPGTSESYQAMDEIWKSLMKEYPDSLYTCSITSEVLKSALPEALNSFQPFVVAFAPENVKGTGRWEWETYFRELAGQSITFTNMSPSIHKPDGGVYGFGYGDNKMIYTVDVPPFGSGTYSWWCQGDFGGSTVTLDYGRVSSYTTLSSN
jgi:hypothetical protein